MIPLMLQLPRNRWNEGGCTRDKPKGTKGRRKSGLEQEVKLRGAGAVIASLWGGQSDTKGQRLFADVTVIDPGLFLSSTTPPPGWAGYADNAFSIYNALSTDTTNAVD